MMLGNHDFVRFGDLLQRAGLAEPDDPEWWKRHELAFMVQAAYSGSITRYYGEELGDEVPGFAQVVGGDCAAVGLCDDHVARSSAKIPGVSVAAESLSAEQQALLDALDAIPWAPTCPHGRPVAVPFELAEIERRFGRR